MTQAAFAAVVKVGGSLSHGPCLAALCAELCRLARHHRLLIVPGGGPFADVVRETTHRYSLGDDAAHWMAILGMNQYGYLLADLAADAVLVASLAQARQVAGKGQLPILLPYTLLHRQDPLPHSWDVTSDSLAAWLCQKAGAERLILLKDVNGLYNRDPHATPGARLLPTVEAHQAATLGGVDAYFHHLLPGLQAQVWVLNGCFPERVADVLETRQPTVTGTRLVTNPHLA